MSITLVMPSNYLILFCLLLLLPSIFPNIRVGALNLALPGGPRGKPETRSSRASQKPRERERERERRGSLRASQNRKPSCLRAHVIEFHIMGRCSRCQKRPPALGGPGHQVPPLNRPLWRTRGPGVPGALAHRALPGRRLPLASWAGAGTSLRALPFPVAGEAPEKNPLCGRPPPTLVISILA